MQHNRNKQPPNRGSWAATLLGTGLGFPSCSGREWQFDSERRAPADLRSKVYRTIEKLHNSKRARKSDSAASRTRGEEQLKNLLAVFNCSSPRVREAAESDLRARFELCSFSMVR